MGSNLMGVNWNKHQVNLGESKNDLDEHELKQVLSEARWTQDPFWCMWIETSTGWRYLNLVKAGTYFDQRKLKQLLSEARWT